MKITKKRKSKSKAILGIGMAVVMLISAIVLMIGGTGAESYNSPYNIITVPEAAGEIAIEADTTSTVELKTVTLIVTGVAGDAIKVEATPCEGAYFKAGIEDTPTGTDYHGNWFNDTIKSGGVMKYAIKFCDTGTFTINVTVEGGPRDGEYDTVDIAVSEKAVAFDLPSTVVIGDRITIKGTANTGTYVSVFVEDTLYAPLRNLVLEDGEFEKEVTTTDVGMSVPGSVRLKAWIDCAKNYGDDPPTTTPDGEDVILLTTHDLTAKLSPAVVAPKGDFTIEGTTKGVTEVAILCVPPKGGGGNSLTEDRRGITLTMASVSATDGTFIKNLTVQENATLGYYDIYSLSTGMDGVWDATSNSSLIGAIYERYNIKDITDPAYAGTKTQDEIYNILVDLTTTAGSDDLMWTEKLKVDTVFDTGSGTYPSISGTHNGTITSYHDLNVSEIYTYSCPGTGGHTEYVAFYNTTTGEEIANGTWNGYHGAGDYQYIEFDSPFVLKTNVPYNYTIRTGSYPQIIHESGKEVAGGVITCTEFIDANGKRYNNWIPAIKLE